MDTENNNNIKKTEDETVHREKLLHTRDTVVLQSHQHTGKLLWYIEETTKMQEDGQRCTRRMSEVKEGIH